MIWRVFNPEIAVFDLFYSESEAPLITLKILPIFCSVSDFNRHYPFTFWVNNLNSKMGGHCGLKFAFQETLFSNTNEISVQNSN